MRTARRVRYRIRLLGFDLEPCAEAFGVVRFGEQSRSVRSNANGIVSFGSPDLLDSCVVEWEAPDAPGSLIERKVVFSDTLEARFGNLGYPLSNEEEAEHRETFRREFALGDEVSDEQVDEMVTSWHETGRKPEVGSIV